MANSTISGLTNAGTLTGTERVPIVQGGSTVDCTTQAIANLGTGRVLLGTQTGTGSSGTLTFSSISSAFSDLVVVLMGRTSHSNVRDDLFIRFNNDSGTTYSRQIDYSQTGTAAAYNTSGATSGYPGWVPAATASSGAHGLVEIVVPAYTGSQLKIAKTELCMATSNAAGVTYTMNGTTVWHSTSAVNRIDLIASNGNWTSTTTARLYGLV